MARNKRIKKEKSGLGYIFRNFSRKHRISIRDQRGDEEVWYMYISPLRIVLAIVGLLLVMFAAVFLTAVYTPLLDRVPGYPGKKSREIIIDSIVRLDSLENELSHIRAYSQNVALIMDGKVPEISDSRMPASSEYRELIPPSQQDSLFREQIRNGERYALSTQSVPISGARTIPVTFIAPVEGTITAAFNPVNGMYGIGYTLTESQQVVASRDGTVIMSMWTPSDEYIIQIQHKDNFISTYRHNSQLLKQTGDQVDAGEAIAYVTVAGTPLASWGQGEFVFELWSDGRPVDPSHYISF